MSLDWQTFDASGKFKVSDRVQGSLKTADPGNPLGEDRNVLPGSYPVLEGLQATVVENQAGSFDGRYYTIDAGEPIVVPSNVGEFLSDAE